mmetsp:Transcript_64365/g.123868  ORF Transcript_64365/g.123868 Transcript_64365/m.123868 type:complete len:273 (+) Transcript_64365:64-882(+)
MVLAQSPGWRRQFRNQFRKTKLCHFNAVGECNAGQKCAFAHSPGELEAGPNLTKTTLCSAWQRGQCPRAAADCRFAHGSEDLRLTPAFNNTKFSQRTRVAQNSSNDSQRHNLLDSTNLAEDVLSDSSEGSTCSGSMSRESTSSIVQDLLAVSCGPAQKEGSSITPRNVIKLEDEALMSWSDPWFLTSLHQLPAPPGLVLPDQSFSRPIMPAPPGLDPPMQCLRAPPGLGLPGQSLGRPMLPAPPGLGPPPQSLGELTHYHRPAAQFSVLASR